MTHKTRNRRESRPRGQAELDKITSQWIVGWDDRAPISITFDLKDIHDLSRIRLFYSGTMPSLQVSGRGKGQTWEDLASAGEETVGEDIKDVVVHLRGTHRYVRLDLAARRGGERFELCEVEIWGQSTK